MDEVGIDHGRTDGNSSNGTNLWLKRWIWGLFDAFGFFAVCFNAQLETARNISRPKKEEERNLRKKPKENAGNGAFKMKSLELEVI